MNNLNTSTELMKKVGVYLLSSPLFTHRASIAAPREALIIEEEAGGNIGAVVVAGGEV